MTVAELIGILSKLPAEAKVFFPDEMPLVNVLYSPKYDCVFLTDFEESEQ